MKLVKSIGLMLAFLLFTGLSAQAATWTVPGQFGSLQDAVNYPDVHDGDTIQVTQAGSYGRFIMYDDVFAPQSSPSKSLTFVNTSGGEVSISDMQIEVGGPNAAGKTLVLDGFTARSINRLFYSSQPINVTLRNCKAENTTEHCVQYDVNGAPGHLTLEDCDLQAASGKMGVVVNGVGHTVDIIRTKIHNSDFGLYLDDNGTGNRDVRTINITDSQILNNAQQGIALFQPVNVTITNSQVSGNGNMGLFVRTFGGGVTITGSQLINNGVRNVMFQDCANDSTARFDQCEFRYASTENNLFFYQSPGTYTINNCLLVGATESVIYPSCGVTGKSLTMTLTNSTLVGQCNWLIHAQGTTNSTIKNCIFAGVGSSTNGIAANNSTDVVNADTNLFFNLGAPAYQLASNVSAITGDPKFVTPMTVGSSNGDFHLQAGSPAIDAGLKISVKDLDDHWRPAGAANDIGCYEYNSVPVELSNFSID